MNNKDIKLFWKTIYKNNLDKKTVYQLFDFIFSLILNKEFSYYNYILRTINIKEIDIVLIVGLLRNSFLHRYNIKNWTNFLIKSGIELNSKGRDLNSILSGLIPGKHKDLFKTDIYSCDIWSEEKINDFKSSLHSYHNNKFNKDIRYFN